MQNGHANVSHKLSYRKADRTSDLAFLLGYPSLDVLEMLEKVLHTFKGKEAKGKEAKQLLQQLDERKETRNKSYTGGSTG
jgi:hypothetical protein